MNLLSVNPRTSTCGSTAQAFTLPAADLQDLCNTPPIDSRRLLENCLGKPAFAVSLLEEFAKTATGRLEELAAQSQQGNLHTIADMVHGLRGVAAFVPTRISCAFKPARSPRKKRRNLA